MQRLCYGIWLRVRAEEAQQPGGHVGPSGEGQFPCPKELGGEVAFVELWRAWGQERSEDGEEEEEEGLGPEGSD